MNYYDVAIIGSGFFGLRLALFLAKKGKKVCLLEKENDAFAKASLINQARIHNGYHYPRSYPTAFSSHNNYESFIDEYKNCIEKNHKHVYAIAKKNSLVNSKQFETFCKKMNLPLEKADLNIKNLFTNDLIENVYMVEEAILNASKIKVKLLDELKNYSNIDFFFNTNVNRIKISKNLVHLISKSNVFKSKSLYNVTYANLNELIETTNFEKIPLKFELAEIALIEPAKVLQNLAFTVMDGPYFSSMYSSSFKCHTLTHVRYTPHLSWNYKSGKIDSDKCLNLDHKSNWAHMFRDSYRYLPALKNSKYLGSKYAVKAIVMRNEINDGRPIVVKKHSKEPLILSVLGSKFDNIYDLENYLVMENIVD